LGIAVVRQPYAVVSAVRHGEILMSVGRMDGWMDGRMASGPVGTVPSEILACGWHPANARLPLATTIHGILKCLHVACGRLIKVSCLPSSRHIDRRGPQP
jgi:hypothetical protein